MIHDSRLSTYLVFVKFATLFVLMRLSNDGYSVPKVSTINYHHHHRLPERLHRHSRAQKVCAFAFADYRFLSLQRLGTIYIIKSIIVVAFLDNVYVIMLFKGL